MKRALLIILSVLTLDQALKLWIKLSWPLGESKHLAGDWMQFHYIENPGMAFGLEFGGETGKLALSLFRLLAISGIAWYLSRLLKDKQHPGLIASVALILAGAVGNMIDSALYGIIFDKGSVWNGHYYEGYLGISQFCNPGNGYAGFLRGNVVDMLYFPVMKGQFPEWLPMFGGEPFLFFRPVFNIADASITIGVFLIILNQKKFFRHQNQPEPGHVEISSGEEVLPETEQES